MKIKLSLLLSFLLFLSLSELRAQNYAASLQMGTLGINLEAIRSFGPEINARIGFSFYSQDINNLGSSSDYTTMSKLNLLSFFTFADWFPFNSSFRLTGGLIVNLNKGSMTLTPLKTYYDGNIAYTPEKLGNLTADIDFNKIAPYIGLGFGNPTAGKPGLGFSIDIGTFYQGSPKASMTANKLLEPSASQAYILQNNIKWFKFYPVLSFGLTYKF